MAALAETVLDVADDRLAARNAGVLAVAQALAGGYGIRTVKGDRYAGNGRSRRSRNAGSGTSRASRRRATSTAICCRC
jgi:hypothetical protein